MKRCGKCKIEKTLDSFCKNNRYKDGRHDTCKVCRKEYNINNREKSREYNEKNKEKHKKYREEYYKQNSSKIQEYNKQYYSDPTIKQKRKKYYEQYLSIPQNKSQHRENIKQWFISNPEYMNQYMKNRYNNDLQFKVKSNIRTRFYHTLKGTTKKSSVLVLLGCEIDFFIKYIAEKFLPEMTWENHGEIWEIDHILPCASFDLTILEEQQKCFHYTNLQPLFSTTEIAESFGYVDQIGNKNKGKNI
jgi:hypothetical protein